MTYDSLTSTAMRWEELLCDTRVIDLNTPRNSSPAHNTVEATTTKGDTRSEYERDYDRALFSTPVRRLQDKAQVFPLEPHDSVRTRLTHSLEVSNIAQSIANRVVPWMIQYGKIGEDLAPAIKPIAATCGLIHDLGNPPFGHAGEEAMRAWFNERFRKEPQLRQELDSQSHGLRLSADFEHFEGNAQTLRLITRLQMLADFDGLNLTCATLSAALKYTARADQLSDDIHEHEKPGYFFSERDLVEKVRAKTGTGNARNPITFFVEASDDIVYSVVDLEDGIKKGALTWDQLRDAFSNQRWAGKSVQLATTLMDKAENNVKRRLERAGLTAASMSAQALDEAKAQMFRTYAIGVNVDAVVAAFKKYYEEIMRGQYHGELIKSGDTGPFVKACKQIARERVFTSSDIIRLELMGKQVIFDLMDFFWEGAKEAPFPEDKRRGFAWKTYSLLSENYRTVFENDTTEKRIKETGLPVTYRRLQLVADYICGMTDTFACTLHQKLMNG